MSVVKVLDLPNVVMALSIPSPERLCHFVETTWFRDKVAPSSSSVIRKCGVGTDVPNRLELGDPTARWGVVEFGEVERSNMSWSSVRRSFGRPNGAIAL